MTHEEKAVENFLAGYNCAQSVFLAFAEDLGLEPDFALRLASSFGGGMGRLREVCGGVSGILMAAGLLYGYTSPDNDETKAAHYALVQELAEEFSRENGSIICRELLSLPPGPQDPTPQPRTQAYYKLRPCPDKVASAAAILEQYLRENP